MAADADPLHLAQHERLLGGLAASIREKGLDETQVSDIVRHARASRRTFYKHFADKDACFEELKGMIADAIVEQVDRAVDREAPVAVQCDQAIDAYVNLLMGDVELTRTLSSPALANRVLFAQREGYERIAELMVSVINGDPGRDLGIAPISTERAYILVAGIHQGILRAVAREEELDFVAAEAKSVIKMALAASAEPAAG